MRFLRLVALAAVVASGLCAHALNREAFTITKYDLAIRLEPEQQRLGARGKITLRNDSSQPQKVVALQISSSLSWRSIRAAGKPLQFVSQPFTSDIDHTGSLSEAIVTLPAEVNPKDSTELEIGYEGVIPQDLTRLSRVGIPTEIAKHTSWDQIGRSFSAVRGAGYVAWYPITTESADFSEGNSLFEVTNRLKAREAESEFKAVITNSEDGEHTQLLICAPSDEWTIQQSGRVRVQTSNCSVPKVGTDTPTFAMGAYEHQSQPPVILFSLAGHQSGTATYLNAIDPAAKFVTEWFGKPKEPVAIADMADSHAAPFESGRLLLASMTEQDSKLAGINLVHELVHSSFSSQRPWISEGLAHFAEAAYRGQQGGRQAALDLLGVHRSAFLDAEKDVTTSPNSAGQPLATTYDEIFYRSKAAYVWWMLRDMVGDDALKQAIRNYRATDDTDPKYFERLIETASKRDLSWYFDDWVYHDRGLPDVRVASVHPWKDQSEKSDKQVQVVTVTLENVGLTGAEIPFTVRCSDNEVTNRLEVRAKSNATMRVELSCAPEEVVVNDGSVPESDLTNNIFKIAQNENP